MREALAREKDEEDEREKKSPQRGKWLPEHRNEKEPLSSSSSVLVTLSGDRLDVPSGTRTGRSAGVSADLPRPQRGDEGADKEGGAEARERKEKERTRIGRGMLREEEDERDFEEFYWGADGTADEWWDLK